VNNKTLITIFARCFRQIAKLSATVDDGFFVDLLNQESERLLRDYIIFLKHKGIAAGANYVAHYYQSKDLIFQIKNILNLLDILKHLGLKEPITPLLLERDLLLLKAFILNNSQFQEALNVKRGNPVTKFKKDQPKFSPLPNHLGQAHKQIAQFMANHERVQNIEVFAKFSHIAKRTLKRKLSELTEIGAIKRTAIGKKVFYFVPSKAID
jgi:hypothetical protein